MEGAPPLQQDRAINSLLSKRITEDIFQFWQPGCLADHVQAHQGSQALIELVVGFVYCLKHPMVKKPADDCCCLQSAAGAVLQPVNPGRPQRLQVIWEIE